MDVCASGHSASGRPRRNKEGRWIEADGPHTRADRTGIILWLRTLLPRGTGAASGGGGIRTNSEIPPKSALSAEDGAESGAPALTNPPNPDLARVVSAWPDLPEAIRRAVLALIGSATG